MNTIEVYKKLPGKNCGRCPEKTCMAFALSLVKGGTDVENCPYLEAAVAEELRGAKGVDWRESLIASLKEGVRGLDFPLCAGGIGAELIDGSMKISCLGMDFLVSPEGDITTRGYINPWIKILLLHYIRTGGRGEPSGRWVSFSELKAGLVKASSFHRDCEEPLRKLLDIDMAGTGVMLSRLGAEETVSESADHAWRLPALPKIPVLILYWQEDKDLDVMGPSTCRILFDSSADRFLDVESLMFLLEGLANIINHALNR
ncbi:MAG TPA: DUF3786 domain-containing protein [Nitrospirae bacterium]|nr:DUF3786 domain-containing protein [Nitrospirota bacterium]